MKPEFRAKFIKCLYQKSSQGFTLIELMVVIIILGILVSLGLPYFISRTANAKQSEAQQNISSINKAQLAYRSERNSFSNSFDALALGTLTGGNAADTLNYSYTIAAGVDTATISAQAKDTLLRGYYGATLQYLTSANLAAISSVVCEANQPGTNAPPAGTFTASVPECPDNYTELSK